jgi:hypothetical protein
MRFPYDLPADAMPNDGDSLLTDGILWFGEGALSGLAAFMCWLGLCALHHDFKDHHYLETSIGTAIFGTIILVV